ncbi:MAG: CerR family C-terminal domain-containing protein [Deltaproteobacteria bacterium]|nr:CerR family C-terminal domain-containing protein [Deltaproteobacteria bacterium]
MFTCGDKKGTRQRLLESAATIFTEKGYANTSVADICERAAANIASVNYYFRSKDALYRSVLQFTREQAEAYYPISRPVEDNPETRFYQLILALLQRILNREMAGNFYTLVAKEMVEPTSASGEIVSQTISRHQSIMKELIKEICGQDIDDELLLRLYFSILSQCFFFSYNEKGRQYHLQKDPIQFKDAELFARHIADFSLAGMRCCCSLSGDLY